jgi:hypothetical protein
MKPLTSEADNKFNVIINSRLKTLFVQIMRVYVTDVAMDLGSPILFGILDVGLP